MTKIKNLQKSQCDLKREITTHLDLLIGSVLKSPSMKSHNLTTKISGKTVTRYVRKDLALKAKQMTESHKKVKILIQKLSKINWELLNLEHKGDSLDVRFI